MFYKIKKWLITKPATKAAWLSLFITLLFNTCVVYQNSLAMKSTQESVRIAQESLFSSISVSMNVRFPRAWEEQNIQIQNTSPFTLSNVDIYLTQYKIEKDEILQRNQAEKPASHLERFEQKQIITLRSPDVFQLVNYKQYTGDQFYSFVIVSHGEIDNKRFVDVEPFSAATLENQITFFPLYAGKGTVFGGPPKRLIKILDEIEMIEKKIIQV